MIEDPEARREEPPAGLITTPDRSLFSCFGVELEYMIVRDPDLTVAPWADRVLIDAAGRPVSDVVRGDLAWSNELTAHVIELKTAEPARTLDGLADGFAAEVRELNRRLALLGARLLPTAMHPTMRPEEAVLWAHDYSEIYQAFDRIFDCRGHGWSNVQSVHLNLPFANEEEFGRLHAAIRLVLPLLPALAASSPIVEGRATGRPDSRLAYYRSNSARLPALTGAVIPEPVFSSADYERAIFGPIRAALAPHDPAGLLEPEFTNSRGAIGRFSRQSVEIRLLDVQECPAADLAIVRTVVALLRELVAETQLSLAAQRAVAVEPLAQVFHATVEQDDPWVAEPVLLRAFGIPGGAPRRASALWRAAIERLEPVRTASSAEQVALETLVAEGPLARRMMLAWQPPEPAGIRRLAERLASCLAHNEVFRVRS
jgi:glutamate---cysteine ligase / carboxylate-amine ligase